MATIEPVLVRRFGSSKERGVDTWQAVMLAVVALMVGALLPALAQLTPALRAWRTTAERADRALVAITGAALS